MNNMENIKKHFEEEAEQYDSIIKNLVPYYHQMVEAIVNTIPFEYSSDIEVLDLGCGTGTVSRAIKNAFPNAKLTCLDISDNMLRIAGSKLYDAPETAYISSDFYNFSFDKRYDAVVSSLALHHLTTKEDKLNFYKKIYSALNAGGILVNADVVLATTDTLQELYMKQWKSFMCSNIPESEVERKWIPQYYEEDRPVSLLEHFEMLKEAGFIGIDVIWKYYNGCVYTGKK
jgi:tRNA (cmo5U34)-methyltransferase